MPLLTPIIHPNNWGLRQRLGLTTNLDAQHWAQLCWGNPHLHSSFTNLMNNAGQRCLFTVIRAHIE